MSNDVRVIELGENSGARIDGVQLGELDAQTAAAVNQALITHKVVFFRGQHHLDDDTQYAFIESLDVQPTPHPTLKFEEAGSCDWKPSGVVALTNGTRTSPSSTAHPRPRCCARSSCLPTGAPPLGPPPLLRISNYPSR
jgi:alpha-ketoglutarate-dependent taurine dioxygenase